MTRPPPLAAFLAPTPLVRGQPASRVRLPAEQRPFVLHPLPASPLPQRRALVRAAASTPSPVAGLRTEDARAELLELVTPPDGGRGRALPPATQERVAALVEALEAFPPPSGAAFFPAVAGRWSLLYTSRPRSASPIQRAVTGVGALDVAQQLTFDDPGGIGSEGTGAEDTSSGGGGTTTATTTTTGRLVNEVRWPGGVLYVCGAISDVDDGRLFIEFDEAWAEVGVWGGRTVRVPYPVPFKLLGSIATGWLDVTHVGGGVRICRGNKGSAFVLVREGGVGGVD